jgi:FkbM family methyltransferase
MFTRKLRGAFRHLSNAAYIAQAGRAGLKLRDIHAVRSLESLRELESRFGLGIRTVLYVGANQGQELELMLLAYPKAVVHCFEPQQECQPYLARLAARWPGRVVIHALALSVSAGTAVLKRPAEHDQASSLLPPNDQMAKRFPQVGGWHDEFVTTIRLDDWAEANAVEDDILVKLDVQGAEALVLAGGPQTLQRARLVICELAVIPTYTDAPDMPTMFEEFRKLGFGYAGELAQVRDTQFAVVEFDGAFVRPTS